MSIRDLKGDELKVGDRILFVPSTNAMIEGVVVEVSGVLVAPTGNGQPLQGMRRLKMLFMLDIPLPDMVSVQNYFVTHRLGTEGATEMWEAMSRVVKEAGNTLLQTVNSRQTRQ